MGFSGVFFPSGESGGWRLRIKINSPNGDPNGGTGLKGRNAATYGAGSVKGKKDGNRERGRGPVSSSAEGKVSYHGQMGNVNADREATV